MDRDLIVFTIGIHGIPVNLDPSVYRDLENGALKGHFFFNNDHRDRYYYKRVYAGCVRAVDFIYGLSSFDGVNLGVSGNSQGGALSIVTASLDPRVKCIGVIHPALCDLTGYLHGRAGGWPHVLSSAAAGELALINSCTRQSKESGRQWRGSYHYIQKQLKTK